MNTSVEEHKHNDVVEASLREKQGVGEQAPLMTDGCPIKGKIEMHKSDRSIDSLVLEEIEPISN